MTKTILVLNAVCDFFLRCVIATPASCPASCILQECSGAAGGSNLLTLKRLLRSLRSLAMTGKSHTALVFIKNTSFTLTELMVVVVAIGIVAGFAIPNYTKAIERAHLRDATVQLTNVYSANQIYRAQNGVFWPPANGQNLTAINAALSLSILPNGMTYNCDTGATPGTTFTCTAVRNAPAASFTVRVTQEAVDSSNPSCTAGACP